MKTLFLSIVMAVSLLLGCSKKETPPVPPPPAPASQEAPDTNTQAAATAAASNNAAPAHTAASAEATASAHANSHADADAHAHAQATASAHASAAATTTTSVTAGSAPPSAMAATTTTIAAVAETWPALAGPTRLFGAQMSGSTVKIAGDSTIHKWEMTGSIIGGVFEVDDTFPLGGSQPVAAGQKVPAKATVSIPVRSVKSAYTTMDNVYQDAMKATNFGKIEYRLTGMKHVAPPTESAGPWKFDATGELTVAGVTKTITMPVFIVAASQTLWKISGTIPLLMTDYNVPPPCPKIMGGIIKTDPKVEIRFEWAVALK